VIPPAIDLTFLCLGFLGSPCPFIYVEFSHIGHPAHNLVCGLPQMFLPGFEHGWVIQMTLPFVLLFFWLHNGSPGSCHMQSCNYTIKAPRVDCIYDF